MTTCEKLLPQNIDAEQSVLGSVLIDPDALAEVEDILQPDDFYRSAHRTLYAAMLRLSARREPADLVTLTDELEHIGQLEDVGGVAAITSLANAVPTSANVVHYARIVAQKALYRRLIHSAGRIASAAYEEATDALEQAEQAIYVLGHTSEQGGELVPLSQTLSECLHTLDTLYERRAAIIGVPTGYRHVDAPLGGLQRSDLIILAARPAAGKTSLALNIARNAALSGSRVAFFSLEMSRRQLGLRLLSLEAGIDQHRLRLGRVEDEEWERVINSLATLSEGALWIDDTAALSIEKLTSRARRMKAQHGIDLVIVDYLQLMRASIDGKRYHVREQEIAAISQGLKALAKELAAPVLALAQLNRAVEVRASKVPQLSDLRESGALENDADVVLFIYREELYEPENVEARGTADIIIAKHRNGPVGTIRLGFDAAHTRFYEMEFTPRSEQG